MTRYATAIVWVGTMALLYFGYSLVIWGPLTLTLLLWMLIPSVGAYFGIRNYRATVEVQEKAIEENELAENKSLRKRDLLFLEGLRHASATDVQIQLIFLAVGAVALLSPIFTEQPAPSPFTWFGYLIRALLVTGALVLGRSTMHKWRIRASMNRDDGYDEELLEIRNAHRDEGRDEGRDPIRDFERDKAHDAEMERAEGDK